MADKVELLMFGLLQDVVDFGSIVIQPGLMPTKRPKVFTFCTSVEGQMVSGIGVAPSISHPNIISCKCK